VAGAILIGTLPGDPPLNGPWIIELFRHPAHRGVGRALLERALAIAPVPALGLMVTEGNPARRLYEALGFRRVVSFLVVQI
jgi:GNAT superfamily N-acetyltransferase